MDVPADGIGFLKNCTITLVPTVATIRSEVVKFLTTARLNVIMDGRTLDEVHGEMVDLPSLGRRRSNRLEQYNSWSKYLAYMKHPDKYADSLFMIGSSSLYNVSVSLISDIHDKPQVYYLGFTAPTDVITLCFLQSVEHYYATREIAPMITQEHEALSAIPQDLDPITNNILHPVNKDILEPHIYTDHDLTASIEAMGPQHQEESIPITQAPHAVYFPCFQIGVFKTKGSRKRPSSKTRKHRGHLDAIPINRSCFTLQALGIAYSFVSPVSLGLKLKRLCRSVLGHDLSVV